MFFHPAVAGASAFYRNLHGRRWVHEGLGLWAETREDFRAGAAGRPRAGGGALDAALVRAPRTAGRPRARGVAVARQRRPRVGAAQLLTPLLGLPPGTRPLDILLAARKRG